MRYFIDTNVFLRVLIKENPEFFNSSVKLLEKIKKGTIKAVTSSIVLAEIGWTLSSFYKFEKETIIRSLKSIVNLHGLAIEDEVNWLYALDFFGKKKVKLIDCLIASRKEIRERKWVVISFDQEFDKLGVKRLEPNQA